MRAALASAFPLALAVLAVLAVGAYARPVIYVEKGPLHFPVAKTFELKATAADDGDGQITSGRWDQISSPTGYVQAETPASTGVEYILKIFQPIAGEYVFRFTATSSSGESASAEVHVIVAASGAPPIVELSVPDHLVVKLPEGQVQISGSCKDPDADGFISRYLWMVAEGPENGVVLAGSDTSTLTATFALPGIYRIHFECKDKTQAAVSKMVKVLVVSGALSVAEKQVRDLPLGEHYEIRATPSSSLAEIGKFGLPVNYEWRQISGPSQISLSAVTTPVLQICSAVEGEYRFGIHMLVGGISVDEKEVVLSIGGAVFSRVLGAIVATLLVLLLFVNMATLAMSGTPPKSFFVIGGAISHAQLLALLLNLGTWYPPIFQSFLFPLRIFLAVGMPGVPFTAETCAKSETKSFFWGALFWCFMLMAFLGVVRGVMFLWKRRHFAFPQLELYLGSQIVLPVLLVNSASAIRYGGFLSLFGLIVFASSVGIIVLLFLRLSGRRPIWEGSEAVPPTDFRLALSGGGQPAQRIWNNLTGNSGVMQGNWDDSSSTWKIFFLNFRPSFFSWLFCPTFLSVWASVTFVIGLSGREAPLFNFLLLFVIAIIQAAHCILFTPYLAPVSNMASSAMHCSTVLTLVFASGNREATFVGGFLLFLNTLGLLLKIVQELSDCTAVFKNAWWPDAAPVWSSRSTGGILSDTERGKSQFIGTYKTFQVFQASELDAPFAKRGFGSEISKRGWGVEVLSSGDAFVFCDGNHKILLADQAVCSEIDREIAKAGIQEVGLTVERESTPPEQGFPVFEIGDYFSRIAGNKSGTNSWRGHPCQVACIDHPGTPSGKSFAGVRVAASLDRALRAAFGGKFYNVSRVFDFFLMKNTSKNAGSHTVAAVITPTDCSLTAFLRMVSYSDSPATCTELLRNVLCQLLVALKAAQMTSLDYSGFEINAVMVSIPGEFVPEFEKRRLSKAKAQLNSSSALDGKRFLHYVFVRLLRCVLDESWTKGPETFTIDLTKSPLVVISNFNASARILNARGEVGTTILNSARTPPPKDCSGDIPKFALALLQVLRSLERSLSAAPMDSALLDLLANMIGVRNLDDLPSTLDEQNFSAPPIQALLAHPFFGPCRSTATLSHLRYGNTVFFPASQQAAQMASSSSLTSTSHVPPNPLSPPELTRPEDPLPPASALVV